VVPIRQVLGEPADDGRVAKGAPGTPRITL
jgi:hypothetical protein